ncbi:MAG TPA: chemotaxis protein CheA, partial [Gammaproteobacteria bacterium]|nr:chemotaxis protein CheA [Gammaproteobacteria bacterium]
MSIDITQFHQAFFEESFEGLETMESALLALGQEVDDPDLINQIFRAAHSIKGGSGTFGFTAVAGFTHVMETLLDEMRDGRRTITADAIELLLESGDVLRGMLEAARDSAEFDADHVTAVQARLEEMLGSDSGADAPETQTTAPVEAGWEIHFLPMPHLLKTGNDPVRMFRELATLGELQAEVDSARLPTLTDFDPEECYLSWQLTLKGEVTRAQIDEIFEWVDGDCELDIQPLDSVAEPTDQPGAGASVDPDAKPSLKAAPEQAERRKGERRSGDSSIRVNIEKIDELINMVGELVITQSMLGQFGDVESGHDIQLEKLRDGLSDLERNTRELQESVMRIRMLPISFAFNRFPRLVHDLSNKLGKKIELKMSGESTELDKTVMEKIGDPLVHLVRNSLDHGIENPDERIAAGKPETGTIHLNAYHQGGNVVIEISDDGRGLDRDRILAKARDNGLISDQEHVSDKQIFDLVYRPGFSTAESVSDVSGRGVGMDVVRRNIADLGGSIETRSETGKGTTIIIRLPLTLAIVEGQLVRVSDQTFVVPLLSIIESLQICGPQMGDISGKAEVYRFREDYIPIIRLYELFGVCSDSKELEGGLLVIIESDGRKAGVFVDDLLGQQQVVIKSLETNFHPVEGVSGA